MKVSLILLLLAALLVAMPVAASAVTAFNGADASMLGTKITIQEEVGGILDAENMTALAVAPNELQTSAINIMTSALSERYAVRYRAINSSRPDLDSSYKPTPGAGGDGLLARFS